ncbi:DUF7475 family protein [Haladaptatus sp. NG-WS-4]
MATSTERTLVRGDDVGIVHSVALVLATITGAIHVYKGLGYGGLPLLLAGAGFFGGIVLFVLSVRRRWLYALGIPYTLAQIVLWLEMGLPYLRLALFDKAVQVLLVVVLTYLFATE